MRVARLPDDGQLSFTECVRVHVGFSPPSGNPFDVHPYRAPSGCRGHNAAGVGHAEVHPAVIRQHGSAVWPAARVAPLNQPQACCWQAQQSHGANTDQGVRRNKTSTVLVPSKCGHAPTFFEGEHLFTKVR